MFGGFDPFGNIGAMMHRQMRDMENMMDSMMMGGGPLGMMGGGHYHGRDPRNPRNQMIQDAPHSSHHNNRSAGNSSMAAAPRDPFGFHDDMMMMPFGGGLFGGGGLLGGFNGMMQQMEALKERAANDPNSHVFSQSTVISVAPGSDGRMKYYEQTDSLRKAGEVKETRHSVRDTSKGVEKMSIGHHIGERGHVIEKKRGRGGRIVENQEFIGMKEDNAHAFDREWSGATRQAAFGDRRVEDGGGRYHHHQRHLPIEGTSRGEARERHASPYARAKDRKKPKGPIIEEAD